jgi:hypothetical protein
MRLRPCRPRPSSGATPWRCDPAIMDSTASTFVIASGRAWRVEDLVHRRRRESRAPQRGDGEQVPR